MSYSINNNDWGGLSWNIDIISTSYEDLGKFIKEIINTEYTHVIQLDKQQPIKKKKITIKKEEIVNFKMILTEDGRKYFELIKDKYMNTLENEIDIIDINSYQRLIIYIICKIFSLSYSTIKENGKILIPCTDFLPSNQGLPRSKHITHDIFGYDMICGCSYAPKWFSKNHHDNNYEDTISYSYRYNTKKIGVKIFKSIIS